MAAVPITVPSAGESISEGILSRWLKPDGSAVKSGDPIFEIETDKASAIVPAPSAGTLKHAVARLSPSKHAVARFRPSKQRQRPDRQRRAS